MSKDLIEKEQIIKARQANLAEYLISQGEPLERVGGRYRHRDFDSLVFTKNSYYWNSKGEHGNAIDYLVRHHNMNFNQAVTELIAGEVFSSPTDSPSYDEFVFDKANLELDLKRTIAYLSIHRGISKQVIDRLIREKLLFQEAETNNAIFPIYDEKKKIVGAETAGTLTHFRFKGVKNGSKYGYGYNVFFGQPKHALFFESAIDLISFMDNQKKLIARLDGALLVSMAGLKEAVVKTALQAFDERLIPVLCVDNDSAGDEFINRLQVSFEGLKAYRPDKRFKDWNDQLRGRSKEEQK